jgi:hypothetical protein
MKKGRTVSDWEAVEPAGRSILGLLIAFIG